MPAKAQRRWNTPAPRPGEGPLMSRRADRELPGSSFAIPLLACSSSPPPARASVVDLGRDGTKERETRTVCGRHRHADTSSPWLRRCADIKQTRFRWSRSLPLFLALVAVSGLAIFNYQKTSSPIVSSTLYALRTSPRARALLGDDIYFKQPIPWIRGEMNQLQGRIDIYFTVRGSRGAGVMRFASNRPTSRSLFETTEWSLKMDDGEAAGRWVDLLEEGDPFRSLLNDDVAMPVAAAVDADADLNATRGFRQQGVLNK
ncbi:cytochrome oxidase complex assembly protein [Purpureocillium lavendulum]|uniref:Cytochrome oxidase complex assembly protein n=1 Tax=Purpureocillium lavendulum TaxID=1247861 RepID=A0AB34FKB4_9HYPO|nr:cytochrome oxidase complex assembly protein [Purpureocillium lavendulum]